MSLDAVRMQRAEAGRAGERLQLYFLTVRSAPNGLRVE